MWALGVGAGVPDSDEDARGVAGQAEFQFGAGGGLAGVGDEFRHDEKSIVGNIGKVPFLERLCGEGAGQSGGHRGAEKWEEEIVLGHELHRFSRRWWQV
jgi:hypothetical protein